MLSATKITAMLAGFLVGLSALSATRGFADTARGQIYDPDTRHLWNRLHAALFVRVGPDAQEYGFDRLEPLLWSDSKYMLNGPQSNQIVALLEEFIRENGEKQITQLTKRAILQRDLWLVANWLIDQEHEKSRRLLEPLAIIIRRLALTPDQIAQLPDNYSASVVAKTYANQFDLKKNDRAYLPPNLFSPTGPWICVGRTDGRTAPSHLGDSHHLVAHTSKNSFTNSTFLVFVKLPAGRNQGLEFVKDLAKQTKPMFIITTAEAGQRTSSANLDLPKLPMGSELALVRKAMLIDSNNQVVASPLTESIQLRVMTNDTIPKADGGGTLEGQKIPAAFEWELRRANLFANAASSLQDVSLEQDFLTGFFPSISDEFELDRRPTTDRFYPLQPFEKSSRQFRRPLCFSCHGVSNLYGTRSFQRPWYIDEEITNTSPPLFPVAAMSTTQVEQAAIKWKTSDSTWKTLRNQLTK